MIKTEIDRIIKSLLEEKDVIPGGLSQGMSLEQIAKSIIDRDKRFTSLEVLMKVLKQELRKGIKVEKEHTSSSDVAEEIAKDHLMEDPFYYHKLSKMEKQRSPEEDKKAMTYTEIKTRITKIEHLLESLKDPEYESNLCLGKHYSRVSTHDLTVLKEVLSNKLALLDESTENYMVKLKSGDTDIYSLTQDKAQTLAKDSNIAGVKSTSGKKLKEQEETGFNTEEVKQVARGVGKSLAAAMREGGDELASMRIVNISPSTFTLQTVFRQGGNTYIEGAQKEFPFLLKRNALYILSKKGEVDLLQIRRRPSGDPEFSKDLLKAKLEDYFRQEGLQAEQVLHNRIKRIVEQAFYEVLQENAILKEEEPQPEQGPDMQSGAKTELPDATDEILLKFPTLRRGIEKLQTKDFKQFVDRIDWISPRPSTFRINLKNGQDYLLKWTGTGFEAEIMGKSYYIDKLDEFQVALSKLGILYKEGPMVGGGEEETAGGSSSSSSTGGEGGGGNFPGGEKAAAGGGEEAPEGEEGEAEEPAAGGEISFEEPA